VHVFREKKVMTIFKGTFHCDFSRVLWVFLWALWLTPAQGKTQDNGINSLRQTSKAFASVARAISPSVVFIQVESKASTTRHFPFPFNDNDLFGKDLFERFFGERFRDHSPPNVSPNVPQNMPQNQPKVIGQGSGFVFLIKDRLLSDVSYILTNNHVVENAENIKVILQDKREFTAKVVGTDPQSDVAVLEINTSTLPALNLGDSSALEVGEWVIAIGNPFGLSHTLTVGVVSAKGRTSLGINDYEDFIQTDAAINPGNSGGPLVNLDGEVVGMNTAIFSRSGGYMGIGFAIPINLAISIAEQLTNKGKVTRGHLGVVVQELSAELADSFDLQQNEGILIAQIMENSPAAEADLREGDVIIGYQKKPVTNVGAFRNWVALSPPNSQQSLRVLRNGKPINLTVTIGHRDKDPQFAQTAKQPSAELGLTVQTITPSLAQQYNVKQGKGVLVTAITAGSVAAMAGMDQGTVILQVNRVPINSTEQFSRALKKSSQDKSVLLLLLKNNMQRYVVLNWS
jgi:serine protease Do